MQMMGNYFDLFYARSLYSTTNLQGGFAIIEDSSNSPALILNACPTTAKKETALLYVRLRHIHRHICAKCRSYILHVSSCVCGN